MGAEEDEEDVSAILLPRPAVKLSMDLPTIPLPQPRSSTPPVVVAPTTSTRSGFKFKRTLAAASTTASPSTTTSASTPASVSIPAPASAPASASTLAAASSPAAASTPAAASPPAAGSTPAPVSTPASSKSQTPKPSSRYLSFRILNHRASISISSSGLDPAPLT